MNLNQNKHRLESVRLKNWDYSSDGMYFITINTHNREHLFGDVINGKMQYSAIGKIVLNEWNISFKIRDELSCDCFVIMPNHIHGLIDLRKINSVVTQGLASLQGGASLQPPGALKKPHGIAYRTPRSISTFVGGFKSGATKKINEHLKSPGRQIWQPRFHDHVIRDINACNNIRKYIHKNPEKWDRDRFYGNAKK